VSRHVLIAGPTASGKSALATEVAARLGGAVVNADQLQVYDGWRVLTARPSEADEARVEHLLYGHVPLEDAHSAGRWLAEASAVLDRLEAEGRPAVIVGGSGLLFTALTEGLAAAPATPDDVREAGEARLAARGLEAMAAELSARDPETAGRIDLANPRRVMRAWEVLETSGRGLADWWRETGAPRLRLPEVSAVRLAPDRDRLAARIARRFDAMLAEGALEEARAAMAREVSPQAMKALGAAELMAHLRAETTLAEAREAAVTATRRYAKRQLTWGRNRMRVWPVAETAEAARARLP
jgi:tRNA dimethylallyltransferase